jgi:hypothetical protein
MAEFEEIYRTLVPMSSLLCCGLSSMPRLSLVFIHAGLISMACNCGPREKSSR